MEYESVIGQGHIEMLSDDEKYNALYILMKHYHQEEKLEERIEHLRDDYCGLRLL